MTWRDRHPRRLLMQGRRAEDPLEIGIPDRAIAEACRFRRLQEANGLSWADIWMDFCDVPMPAIFGGDDLIYALAATWTRLPRGAS